MFHDLVLRQTAHRPWPMPARRWGMLQIWQDLLFAHWPVPAEMLRPHIPPSLAIDTIDGTAWISVVPFRMSGVRPRNLPAVPWLSAFAELNVRTYVHRPGPSDSPTQTKPGVFFFSLDAANPLAVEIARRVYHLPYFNARMSTRERAGAIHYASRRTDTRNPHPELPGEFQAVYAPTGGILPAPPGTLDYWLAERYALYTTDPRGRLYCGEIHHAPWPLQAAEVDIQINTLAPSVGLALPAIPPRVQFVRRLDVLIWPLQRIATPV